MSKCLILVLALAFVVGIAFAAYAEVQNVKVGGDVTILGISRYGFNLTEEEADASILAHIARLKIDADLTDAVALTMILRNEAIWGTSARTTTSDDNEIDLACAFVTMKEFLNEKVSLKLGKMPVRLGAGLLIGDPDTNQSSGGPFNPGFGDLSSRKAFTGGIATIDLSPVTLTLGGLKVSEGQVGAGSDTNAYIANLAYDTGVKNTVVEVYDVLKDTTSSEVNNVGVRVVSAPIENLTATGELVYQNSKLVARSDTKSADDMGLLLTADYAFPKVQMTPKLGLLYLRVSDNWDSMYEDLTAGDIINAILPLSNCQAIGVNLTAKPMEDVTAKLSYTNARLLTAVPTLTGWTGVTGATVPTYTMTSKKDLGNEIDLKLTYDYTEDVQFGLDLGYFMPGKAFDKNTNRDEASQLIGSMKVTF